MYQVKLPTPDKFEFRAFNVTVHEPKTTWVTSRPAYYFPAGIKIEVIDDVVAIHYAASGDSPSVQTNSWRRPTMVICEGPVDRDSTAVWTVTLRFETKRELEINYSSAPMLPLPLRKLVQAYHKETACV